jgi:hypothetical protein
MAGACRHAIFPIEPGIWFHLLGEITWSDYLTKLLRLDTVWEAFTRCGLIKDTNRSV